MSVETYWNGEATPARQVTVEVADGDFPLYWARHLVGTRRAAVEVTYGDDVFYLDDDDYEASPEHQRVYRETFGDVRGLMFAAPAGRGWHKVTEGMGSPGVPHRNLLVVPGSVVDR